MTDRAKTRGRGGGQWADGVAPDWSRLCGVEIRVDPDQDDPLRGVVLLANDDTPAGHLRIGLTHRSAAPPEPGETMTVDPDDHVIDPMPDAVDDRYLPSPRKTRGPNGLPLYHGAETPTTALASKSDLARRLRRKPAEGQEAIAERWGYDYSKLYAVADTVEMRPLTQAERERRTCSRCATEHNAQLRESRFGPRYCAEPCVGLEAEERWWAARDSAVMDELMVWARTIKNDPRSVWIDSRCRPVTPLLIARIHERFTLLDVSALTLLREEDVAHLRLVDTTNLARLADVLPTVEELVDHKLVSWGRGAAGLIEQLGRRKVDAGNKLVLDKNNDFGRRDAEWLGLPTHEPASIYPCSPDFVRVAAPDDPEAAFTEAVAVLDEMAEGPPSAARRSAALARRAPEGPVVLTFKQAYGVDAWEEDHEDSAGDPKP